MKANTLRGKISECGMSVKKFCKVADFARSTFDRKMKGESSFDLSEANRIRDVLHLTDEETCNIFFTNEVT